MCTYHDTILLILCNDLLSSRPIVILTHITGVKSVGPTSDAHVVKMEHLPVETKRRNDIDKSRYQVR